jgi:hypothetical protein
MHKENLLEDEHDVTRQSDAAWDDPGWREAARDYHKTRGKRASIVPYAPEEIARLRRLMDNDVSFERAWRKLDDCRSGTTAATVEALVYGLREGLAALASHPNRLRRLSELSLDQVKDVCRRLQSFNPKIATPWTSDQAAALITKWEELHGQQ